MWWMMLAAVAAPPDGDAAQALAHLANTAGATTVVCSEAVALIPDGATPDWKGVPMVVGDADLWLVADSKQVHHVVLDGSDQVLNLAWGPGEQGEPAVCKASLGPPAAKPGGMRFGIKIYDKDGNEVKDAKVESALGINYQGMQGTLTKALEAQGLSEGVRRQLSAWRDELADP